MYIKIYFQDKPLYLCDDVDSRLQPYLHHDDVIFIDELNNPAINSMIHEMQQPRVHAGIYFHPDLETLKKAFFKKFTWVPAAGGFVQNEKGEVLMMFRRGKWDLPKGKMDKNETPQECALRETKEETGLKNIKLQAPLITTWHSYHEGSRFMLKETKWFLMQANGNQPVSPQTEEDITQLVWVKKTDLKKYLSNSYPSVQDVLEAGFATTP